MTKERSFDTVWRALVRLLAALVLLLAAHAPSLAQADPPKRVALVIGNSAYAHAPPLHNPGNDARAVAEKLAALDFAVTTAVDRGLEETRRVVLEFGRQSFGAEVSLIFYAGHGLQAFGDNYLLPVDARLSAPEDLLTSSLRAAELHSVFAFAQPRLGILILDACRDNPFTANVTDRRGLASGGVEQDDLGLSRNQAGLLVAFSAAPGAVAEDGEEGNSPFTTALLRWMDRPALEIGDMFRRVRETVLTLTNGAQVPWVEESLTGEVYLGAPLPPEAEEVRRLAELLNATIAEMEHPRERSAALAFFARLLESGTEEAAFLPAAFEAPPEDHDAGAIEESLVWLSIRNSTDPGTFERFLATFPDGIFAELAAERLATAAAGPAAVPDDSATEADLAKIAEPPVAPSDPAAVEAALGLGTDDLAAVQTLLRQAGHYRAGIDGAIGPASRAGIEALQRDAGLTTTGHLDPATLRRLIAEAGPAVLAGERNASARRAIHNLAAVARDGPGAAPVVIRIATHQRHQGVHDYWRTLADEFEAAHPGTVIEYDIRLDIEYRADLLGMLGSDTPPDIFLTYGGGHLRSLVEAGFARELTKEMGEGWALSYKPGSLTNLIIDGRIYAVPMRMTLVSLWANRRLLDRAGIDPDALRSWEGLLDAVRRLRAEGITPIAVGAADLWPMGLYWGALAQGVGGRQAINAALAGDGEGFREPPFVQAGRLLRELAELDAFQPEFPQRTENEAIGTFTDGWAAMTLNGDWLAARALRTWPGGPDRAAEELIRIPFPPEGVGEEVSMTYGGVDSWVVRSEAPEAALEFLRQLAGLESQRTIAALGLGIPAIAGADSAIADPILRAVASELTLSEHHQLYYDQVLGPVAGEALNRAAVALAARDLGPEEAAAQVEAAWSEVRPDAADPAAPAPAAAE